MYVDAAIKQDDHQGRTVADYRTMKGETLEEEAAIKSVRPNRRLPRNDAAIANELSEWGWTGEERGRQRAGLVSNTILEEDDSSVDG